MEVYVNERINAIRSQLKKHGVDAFIVPSNDPHQSEYVAKHWKSREWISGFSGSAGVVIITRGHAGLWTDSRYFIQAEKELENSEMELHRQEVPHAPEHVSWLLDNLEPGSVVSIDGGLFSLGGYNFLNKKLSGKEIAIRYDLDLIGEVWTDRPALPLDPLYEHNVEFAGKSLEEKVDIVREKMLEEGADYYLISTLDDIAWCLNLRGSDIDFNPVVISYLIIGYEKSYFFIYEEKVPSGIISGFQKNNIEIRDYESIESFLEQLPVNRKILVDPRSVSIKLYDTIPPDRRLKGENLVLPLKAVKNETEIGHIREVMKKDGVALLRLYRWLEEKVGSEKVTEAKVAEQLDDFRSEQDLYIGESFSAIVGYQGNGAIIHYRPDPKSSATIKQEGMLLIDSGGQYLDGTTDITRTVSLGAPTVEQKKDYTLVLKGHIALARIKFPEGTSGGQLDTLARMYLWQNGLNYGHGTGHGVGFFLNVHEPPQGFAASTVTSRGTTAFQPGMLTSNEPGFYKTDEYGIRIENLVLCRESLETDYGKFLEFETVTLFPIFTNLILESLLTEEEKIWLNDYHERVLKELSPLLNEEEVKWLESKCQPI